MMMRSSVGQSGKHAVSLVVLLLFAYKEEAHMGIVDDVLDLLFAGSGVDGNRYHTDSVGSKVCVQVLNAVLREHCNVLLGLHSEVEHGVRDLLHAKRELFPRN